MTAALTPAEFANRLRTAGKTLDPQASKVLNKTVKLIRDDWRAHAIAANPVHARGYPYSITASWAKVRRGGVMTAKVGPERGKAAKLGTVLEFGGPRNAPQHNYAVPLARELPIMRDFLAQVAARCLR